MVAERSDYPLRFNYVISTLEKQASVETLERRKQRKNEQGAAKDSKRNWNDFPLFTQCCLCVSLPAKYLQAARNQQMNASNRRGGSKPHAGIVSLWFPQDDGSFRL
ncbi:predicted protein [Histoplasma capsulatum G186AR]|uniref:Uncharacterized protein n=1 Tax=Ajellomyces capsulatus (strain G186AR / H82 / ATCC MYA-2454 / RMSCC 2432) TaxID=447093 RepID=C0NIK0_AJECG|nr:uncharacterized protein HCBG_02257 [Histoplasma capsulatum G186AR]EEH08720.1 predicted protein [Histoplasma capsulatum G186AR]